MFDWLKKTSSGDWSLLREVLRMELAPMRQDVDYIKHRLDETYTKDLVDAKVDSLKSDVQDVRNDLDGFKKDVKDGKAAGISQKALVASVIGSGIAVIFALIDLMMKLAQSLP